MDVLAYFRGVGPAACLLRASEAVAYVEEERLVRVKHDNGWFPIRGTASCLEAGGVDLADVDCVACGWNAPAYSDGTTAAFYDESTGYTPPTRRRGRGSSATLPGPIEITCGGSSSAS